MCIYWQVCAYASICANMLEGVYIRWYLFAHADMCAYAGRCVYMVVCVCAYICWQVCEDTVYTGRDGYMRVCLHMQAGL